MNTSRQLLEVVLVVDIANVMGSRPDGWWRDRTGAATRLLASLGPIKGTEVMVPTGEGRVRIVEVCGVVEGKANRAVGPETVSVVLADRDGDSEIVSQAGRITEAGRVPMVVTADRGLRTRLQGPTLLVGPEWLNRLLGR